MAFTAGKLFFFCKIEIKILFQISSSLEETSVDFARLIKHSNIVSYSNIVT